MSIQLIPLTELHRHNGAFSKHVPGLQTIWDSTSYAAFCRCPWEYHLSMMQGIDTKHRSRHLTFGIAWHSALERFHQLRAQGESHETAVEWTVAETYYRQLRTPVERELYESGFHEECLPDPMPGKREVKTPRALVRSLVAYLDHYRDDPYHTVLLPSGRAAVELSFRVPIPDTPFWYGGHFDRVVAEAPLDLRNPPKTLPNVWVLDYKPAGDSLTEYYFDQFRNSIQFKAYNIGGRVGLPVPAKGVIVDAIRIQATGCEFARQKLVFHDSQLEEFVVGFKARMRQAEQYAHTGEWPMNEASCMRRAGFCQFHQVCTKSPAVRASMLSADFTQRVWDPSKNR